MSLAAPTDLLTTKEAATISERTPRTIRRWTTEGHLQSYPGPSSVKGGPPSLLVSKADLMKHLAVSGQEPAKTPLMPMSAKGDATEGRSDEPQGDTTANVRQQVELVELRGQLETERVRREVEQLRGELAALEAQKVAADERANALGLELDRTRFDLAGARGDVNEWKERYDAQASELAATRALLQQEHGMSIWQRLISGPTKALAES